MKMKGLQDEVRFLQGEISKLKKFIQLKEDEISQTKKLLTSQLQRMKNLKIKLGYQELLKLRKSLYVSHVILKHIEILI